MLPERKKHIAVNYYFIRDIIEDGVVDVLKIHTNRNSVEILTNVVLVGKLNSELDIL